MSLVSTLSKKTSQLITTLDPSGQKSRPPRPESCVELSQVDIAADVMTSSRSLINWLDRNSTNLVLDYNDFRQTILKDALELSTIPVRYNHKHTHTQYAVEPQIKDTLVNEHLLHYVPPINIYMSLSSPVD